MNSDNYIKINNDYFLVGYKLKLFIISLIDCKIDDEVLAKLYYILYWQEDLQSGDFIYRVTNYHTIKCLIRDKTIEHIFIDNKAIAEHLPANQQY